ncbi:Crp/Fnr family transcriptional regulator [Desulfocurvus sp.]|jgi:CRP/FNR family transcriptional regulator|uniref:Crp/Fnr family transcriptional regulator n=1 Tax=Desulfocurvus sp. TaxID=2871698 RepID=UPI0025B7DCD2|nr:Crp/Fnr family transcriptional regulator [Desulfocurvus sp.]MCK9239506.1 Crp/Fnr family transcriptional regulator [Desulfocurvus sp.]
MELQTFLKSRMPLFRGLEDRQIEALASICVPADYPKGRTIFLEGSQAQGLYVVMSGQVKIFKLSLEGREQIIHIYGPGEPFGEVPVFEGGRFPANAEATADSRVLFVPRDGLRRLLENDSTLAMNMLAALSRKLRRFTVKLENLTLKETPQRVAAYLLDLSDRSGGAAEVTLDISKGHLAGLLGTAQETLSRVLKRLSEAGLIRVRGKHIDILDPDGLQAVSDGDDRL